MEIDWFTLARVLHIVSVVGWIGGVWFVTFVIMPAITRAEPPHRRLVAFHHIEQGFSAQARWWVAIAGGSGFWMTWQADLWSRFTDPGMWWMHAMLALWLAFALMLFVIEPLALHRRMAHSPAPAADWRRMVRLHRILSVAALITLLGAMAGAHGLI